MQVTNFWKWFFPVVCIFLVLGCNKVDEMTPRSFVSMAVGELDQRRELIADALSKGKVVPIAGPLTLGANEKIKLLPIDFGWVTSSGTIVLRSKKYDVILIQEPHVSPEKVTWSCVVYPVEAKPKLCGT